MNIIEVKNNLVKLNYDEDITLSSFIKISDLRNAYIAQILHLESSRVGKTAIARLIFNFKSGIIQAYDGSVPSIQAEIEILSDDFFLNVLDKTEPLFLGKLAQKNTDVVVSSKLLMDKPIICAEKNYQYKTLVENIIKQNNYNSRKTVVIDVTGEISGNKITAAQDFKIPLNKDSIDYIFDRGFDDLTPENKAFIQDIFSELNDYIKTVEYIPFNDFNTVIDYEFKRTQQLQLIILKNRLTQFEKTGIFAQNEKEFKILDEKLQSDNTLIIDISRLNDSLQKEYISYIYAQMNKLNTNFYAVVSLNNNNSTESTIRTILGAKNVFPIIACPYSYKFIKELKQCSKNMFMFTPIKQQADFGAYNIFLNKLAEDEFILYGKATKFTPLIVGVNDWVEYQDTMMEGTGVGVNDWVKPQDTTGVNEEVEPQNSAGVDIGVNDESEPLNSTIEAVNDTEDNTNKISQTTAEDVLFADLLKQNTQQEETPVMEIPNEEEPETAPITEPEIIQQQEETPVMEIPNEEEPETAQITEPEIIQQQEETPVMEIPNEEEPEYEYEAELKAQLEGINISDDEIADIVAKTRGQEIEITNILEPEEQTINNPTVDETDISQEDDTSLTDEDLDMIEQMDTAIEANPTQQVTPEQTQDIPQTQNEQIQEPEKKTSITDEILKEEEEKKAKEQAERPDPIEEMIEKPQTPPPDKQKAKGLETKSAQTPIVPVYSAEIPDEDIVESDSVKQGDKIEHPEFGRGVVEKIINYGERKLCSVNFEQVGRRLLDPKVSELKKID